MNITPKAGPHVMSPPTATSTSVGAAGEARARAIAKLTGESAPTSQTAPQSNEFPVSNPGKIAPEEMGAIRQKNTSVTSPELKLTQEQEFVAPIKPAAEPANDEPISSKYAQLAKREQAIRARAQQQEAALKAREAAVAEREAKLNAPREDLNNYIPKDRLQQDTVNTLLEAGMSYDQITEAFLNKPNANNDFQLKQLADQVKAVREENQRLQKTYENSQVEARKEALKQMSFQAQDMINSDPSFETIKAESALPKVMKLIERTFDEDGKLLSVEEAAQIVEEHLVEKAIRLSRLTKIQQRLKPAESTQVAAQATTDTSKQQSGSRTLTNSMGSNKPMSSRERAIAAMEGRLQK